MSIPLIIDIAVLIIVFISTLVAFLRGFMREMMTIIGVLGGLFAAYWFGAIVSDAIASWLGVEDGAPPKRLFGMIGYDMVAMIAGYGGVFLITLLLISLVSYLLTKSVHIAGLGPIDRTLGVFFGLGRGVLIVGILYLPFHLMDNDKIQNKWFNRAGSHVYMQAMAQWMVDIVPQTQGLGRTTDKAGKAAGEAINTTRDKLEKLEILKGVQNTEKEPGESNANGKQKGYDPEAREKMKKLIEKESGN